MRIFKCVLSYFFIFISFSSCQSQVKKTVLSPTEFKTSLSNAIGATLIDVRTQGEYTQGAIANATNMDWNEGDFTEKVTTLDKSKPVYLYCLAGKRSSAAAEKLASLGFKQIYELDGGMLKWRAENLPETTSSINTKPEISLEDYNRMINQQDKVLVDFYAEWCGPCKLMKPYLEEMDAHMKDQVKIVRIDVDQNKNLVKSLRIEGLPVLNLYTQGKITWTHTGFMSKEDVLKEIKK
ncbi:MAG: thioredoxin domain-containing protein [Leadbetterella sp.]